MRTFYPDILTVESRKQIADLRQYMKKMVWKRDDYLCMYCGFDMYELYHQWLRHEIHRKEAKLTVDHIIPLRDGGEWQMNNLVTACIDCNTIKGHLPLDKSYEIIFSVPNRSQRIIQRLLEMLVVWGEWAEKRRLRNSSRFRPSIRERL